MQRLDRAGAAAACRLDREQALRLADRLAPALLEKPTPQGVRFPLQFPDPTAEVSLLALLGLMNFGSGWRAELHRASGAGAYQTVPVELSDDRVVCESYDRGAFADFPDVDREFVLAAVK